MWLYGQKPVTSARVRGSSSLPAACSLKQKPGQRGLSILIVNAFGKLRFNSQFSGSEVKYRKFPCTADLEGGS
jgi:hypothetical protein